MDRIVYSTDKTKIYIEDVEYKEYKERTFVDLDTQGT